jgi:hypothetical protein
VTITGTGFAGTSSVKFGSVAASHISIVDGKHLAATAPAHTAGTVDVRVSTAAGTSPVVSTDRFTFK